MQKRYVVMDSKYTVCWCGPDEKRIYVAWYQKQSLGYFKNGTDEENLETAKQACRDHYQQIKKAG